LTRTIKPVAAQGDHLQGIPLLGQLARKLMGAFAAGTSLHKVPRTGGP
jgi:hypothetical protein